MFMEPFRVLMFGWELPPYNTGGLGVACYGLAKGLSQIGVNISFALPRRLPAKIPFMDLLEHSLQGVQVTGINALLKAYQTASQFSSNLFQYQDLNFFSSSIYEESARFATLASDWSAAKPHRIIHAHDWMTFPAGVAAKAKSGMPLITHVHATEYDRTGGAVDSRIADIEYRGLSAADKVIAVSHYTKGIINKFYSIPASKITVVHNGIDPVEFTPQDIRRVFPHDRVVLYVGRLTFQKGVDHFLLSARRVLATHPDTIFLVVGEGDMYQKLIMDAAYLEIAHRVIFTGFLTGDKLKQVYHMADVFVMPSISEPFGLVALEAVSAGVPVIISKQSGVAETLRHVHQVDFWDINKMASLIGFILDFPHLAKERLLLSRTAIREQTWTKAAAKVSRIYQSLAQ